ncbi:MarR family transcriptional regulator [bacterium]|nr:MarR family transcriptional regulator [candidate division CSSED10-310 bacterium]
MTTEAIHNEKLRAFREHLHMVAALCFSGEITKARKLSLTLTQANLLRLIDYRDRPKMSDLSHHMKVTLGRITRVTQEMYHKGLINLDRDAQDRRSVIVTLTDKGRKLREDLIVLDLAFCEHAFQKVSPDKIGTYITCLEGLYSALTEAITLEEGN